MLKTLQVTKSPRYFAFPGVAPVLPDLTRADDESAYEAFKKAIEGELREWFLNERQTFRDSVLIDFITNLLHSALVQ